MAKNFGRIIISQAEISHADELSRHQLDVFGAAVFHIQFHFG